MSEIIEKTFVVTSPARLNLSNIRGSVEVRPGEDGSIHISAARHENSGDARRTEIEMSQESDGTVKVVTRFPDAGWGWIIGSFPCNVDYIVTAPKQCSMKINGVSNEASIEGFEGEFSISSVSGNVTVNKLTGPTRVHTVSGRMELAEVSGEMNLHSVSGKITGRQLKGALHLDTVSGRVDLDESDLPSAEATTVSGGMDLQTSLSNGPYRFNSVSGNVQLMVPPETHCSAELRAVSGSLSTRLPATSTSRQNGAQMVEVQGGGVKVYAHSVSGNLSLVS